MESQNPTDAVLNTVERDIRAVTSLRPRGEPRGIVTGPHLRESLAQLIIRIGALDAQCDELIGRLVGTGSEIRAGRTTPEAASGPEAADEPLFPALARRIVEANRGLERIEATLKRTLDTLT